MNPVCSQLNNPIYGPLAVLKEWREQVIGYLPYSMQPVVVKQYKAIAQKHDYIKANHWLLSIETKVIKTGLLKAGDFKLTNDEQAIKDFAKAKAAKIEKEYQRYGLHSAVALCVDECEIYGFTAPVDIHHPKTTNKDLLGMVLRLSAVNFWRRNMRIRRNQGIDQTARLLNLIHANGQCYISNEAFALRRKQKGINRELLDAMIAENQHGYSASLLDMAEKSNSNPAVRFAELYTRAHGFGEVAKALGHIAEFVTITCPSKYHARSSTKGVNPKYQGYTPKQANDYLAYQVWEGIRKDLHELKIRVYGLRTVEPHHDGCPHWHMMLYMQPEHKTAVRQIIHKHARRVDGKEAGAAKRRCTFKSIDQSKGNAASYLFKYLSKNIEGKGVGFDHYGHDARISALRITEWAGTWCIRQFQMIGGAPVSVWRELRRVSPEQLQDWDSVLQRFTSNEKAVPEIAKRARDFADWGDWDKYTMLMGGPNCARVERPLHLLKMAVPAMTDQEKVDAQTGEISIDKRGRYGDILNKVKGIITSAGIMVPTRFFTWSIQPRNHREAQTSDAKRSPWVTVNNCRKLTEGEINAIKTQVKTEADQSMAELIADWEQANGRKWAVPTPEQVEQIRQPDHNSRFISEQKRLRQQFEREKPQTDEHKPQTNPNWVADSLAAFAKEFRWREPVPQEPNQYDFPPIGGY